MLADPKHFKQLLAQHSTAASMALPYTMNVGLVKFKGRRGLRRPWANVTLYFPDFQEDANPEDMGEEEFVIRIRMIRVRQPHSMGQGSQAWLERGSLQPVPQAQGQVQGLMQL
mmetsp:Transcript_22418/g.76820  ORF Transcript_22418/g.76820 Transcript_22418/m.76820 type:complete len:113 (+) Transcript_22418:265-603(+)